MIGWESRMLLRPYLAEGLSKSAIAERLGVSRKAVTRWIQNGELDRDVNESPHQNPRPPVHRKLDPYRGIIEARLHAYPKLSSVRLLEEIRVAGYDGGYTQLKEFVRKVRPRPPEVPVIRFETDPVLMGCVEQGPRQAEASAPARPGRDAGCLIRMQRWESPHREPPPDFGPVRSGPIHRCPPR